MTSSPSQLRNRSRNGSSDNTASAGRMLQVLNSLNPTHYSSPNAFSTRVDRGFESTARAGFVFASRLSSPPSSFLFTLRPTTSTYPNRLFLPVVALSQRPLFLNPQPPQKPSTCLESATSPLRSSSRPTRLTLSVLVSLCSSDYSSRHSTTPTFYWSTCA